MDVVAGRKQVVVLGGGLVGGFIAKQGSRENDWHITLVDRRRAVLEALQKKVLISTNQADLTDEDVLNSCIGHADLVIVALPGAIGYQAVEWCLHAGKPVVDISFYAEDPRGLQDMAEARQTTAIVDCGVMPGLGGMIAANFVTKLDEAEALKIMVGGLPLQRASAGVFEYKAPFSPADVIEEYIRPARLRVNGEVLTAPPMSDLEHVTFSSIGELEAFNTDGLRTLLHTLDVPNMVEKTLRYPGHTAKIDFLRSLGFFDTTPVKVHGQSVTPLEVSSAVLMKNWELGPEDDEFTILSVEVEGIKNGRRIRHRAELYDQTQFDGTLSMARTTGYPALIAAKLLLSGKVQGPGVIPAETLGLDDKLYLEFLNGFLRYGLNIMTTQRDMGPADEPIVQPLVMPPSALWQPPQTEHHVAEQLETPRAMVAAVGEPQRAMTAEVAAPTPLEPAPAAAVGTAAEAEQPVAAAAAEPEDAEPAEAAPEPPRSGKAAKGKGRGAAAPD